MWLPSAFPPRARSSVGQSIGFRYRRPGVRILPSARLDARFSLSLRRAFLRLWALKRDFWGYGSRGLTSVLPGALSGLELDVGADKASYSLARRPLRSNATSCFSMSPAGGQISVSGPGGALSTLILGSSQQAIAEPVDWPVTPTVVGTRFERPLERTRAARSMTSGPRVAPSEVGKSPRRGRLILGGSRRCRTRPARGFEIALRSAKSPLTLYYPEFSTRRARTIHRSLGCSMSPWSVHTFGHSSAPTPRLRLS